MLDGQEIEGTDAKRGMAFQKPTLFPWLTVEENIAFGPRMQGKKKAEEIERMLELTHLTKFRKAYPHELSGGMAQRVALVRTMINEPEVFLLDEPLGALDAFTRMQMQDELLLLWKEKKNMMLMVTHDAVSYTHLDVYKRQVRHTAFAHGFLKDTALRIGTVEYLSLIHI